MTGVGQRRKEDGDGTPGGRTPWGDGEARSFGAWLQSQRQARQIGLREIADTTRISIRYLQALEADRFDVLPAPIFARGFLREYARYVGLDPEEVVNFYLAAREELDEETAVETAGAARQRHERRWGSALILLLVVALVLAAVAAIGFFAQGSATGEPPPGQQGRLDLGLLEETAATTAPSAPMPAEIRAEPTRREGGVVVTVDFLGESWFESVVDGQRLHFGEIKVEGEAVRIEADQEVVLTLGAPRSVRIEVDGQPWPVDEGTLTADRTIRIVKGRGEESDEVLS